MLSQLAAFMALLKDAAMAWQADKANWLAASLAYYTLFSLSPFLMVIIIGVGLVFGEETAQAQIATQLEANIGAEATTFVLALLDHVTAPDSLSIASLTSALVMMFGASNLIRQIQDALNTIWDVEPDRRGLMGFLKQRLVLFAVVFLLGLLVGSLILASVIAGAVISGASQYINELTGWQSAAFLLQTANSLISFIAIVLLFATIYKLLPAVDLNWNDVWTGAFVTASLFVIGKWLSGFYFGVASVGSAYGAAGSLIVLLIWVNYTAQIFLYGAEFTWVYARRYGSLAESAQPSEPTLPEVEPEPASLSVLRYAFGLTGLMFGLILGQLWRPRR